MRASLIAAVMVVVICAGSCRTASRARPSTGPRHVVVLVHGILGDASHFGRMQDALLAQLPPLDPGVRVDVLAFEYDTFDAAKRTTDFARDLDRTLEVLFPQGPGEGDRISLVMHSQGGLVGLRWIELALHDDARSLALVEHLDAFITLATPFWGSKMATFTRFADPLRSDDRVTPADAQLRDLSFGSDQVVHFRRAAVNRSVVGRPPQLARLRPLAIGGYVEWLAPLAPFASGEDDYEDDTAVLLPSSQPNFLFVDGRDPAVVRVGEDAFAPYVVVNAIHLSPVVESPQVSRGIAQVQSACIDDAACGHPAFGLVLRHLAHRPVEARDDRRAAMTSFLIDVVVGFDPTRGIGPDDIEVTVEPIGAGVAVSDALEAYASGRSSAPGEARLYFTGTLPGAAKGGDRKVRVTIEARGHARRVIEAPVRAAMSTFVDARLLPVP